MSRDEILNMPAGPEMDNLIANRVMGYELLGYPAIPKWQRPTENGVDLMFDLPHYSDFIGSAWMVVEKIIATTGYFSLHHTFDGYWICDFDHGNLLPHETAPLAICRSALLYVMEGE